MPPAPDAPPSYRRPPRCPIAPRLNRLGFNQARETVAAAGYGKALAGATQLLTMFYKQMAATLQVGGGRFFY